MSFLWYVGSVVGSVVGLVFVVGFEVGPQLDKIPTANTNENNFENIFIDFPPISRQE